MSNAKRVHILGVSLFFKATKRQLSDGKAKYYTVAVCRIAGVFGRMLAWQ